MIDNSNKLIKLPSIPSVISDTFTLDNVAGRDAIAEQIEKDIDEYCVQAYVDGRRSHLGASKIGDECERAIWFHFRWMVEERIDGRKARYFNRGHLVEDRIIQWLRGIGFLIEQVDQDGKQFRIIDCGNHFGGSCDGKAVLPLRYGLSSVFGHKLLLEFKTANNGNFPDIKNCGVKKAKPQYWAQICTYAYKLGLEFVLFICIGKNDDDIDVELLAIDQELGKAQIEKAEKIINSQLPPPRISEDASFWKCKMCPAHKACHLGAAVERNCRSCQNAEPIEGAQWRCNLYQQTIPKEFISKGCALWIALNH